MIVPPVVYVPCDFPASPDGELAVDLRPTRDGQVALIVYTALDRLVSCCGPHQPWVVMPTADLDKVGEVAPYDLILLDIEIPGELRREAAR
ncbi:SAV_915 family protein [Lentzea sp. NPDC003310]|uniref:SAV_915 family protein n=1 Tax=Lentzea sp. NPDC003310 TaxID=3154447 RepID=UPI0033B5B3BA